MSSDPTKVAPRILCLRGENLVGRTFDLTSSISFGRSETCDIVLLDERQSVSRRHGQFEVEGDSVFVTDLGSTNGVFVNGERIQKSQVRHGDIVGIGNQFEFQVFLTDQPLPPEGPGADNKTPRRNAEGEIAKNPLTTFVLPLVLVAFALFALIASFRKKEDRHVEIVPKPFEWKVTVPSTKGLPWEATGENSVGVTLTLPFVPQEDPFLYRGERLGGREEVFLLNYLETSGEVLIKDRTQARERVGVFLDISATRSENWSDRSLVEFDGETRWAGTRPQDRVKAADPVSVDFKNVWEPAADGDTDQTFQIVESYSLRDGEPTLKVIELFAQLPYRRVVIGVVCRAVREDLLFDLLQETLKSVRLDPGVLRAPPPEPNVEVARYWIDLAEKGSKTLDQAPENLFRIISAYRAAIWNLPTDFSDGAVDLKYLKNRLKECSDALASKVGETQGRIAANQLIGRRKAVIQEVADLLRRIPDYRDERVYSHAGRYYEVREEFPNLNWTPKVIERIEWQ